MPCTEMYDGGLKCIAKSRIFTGIVIILQLVLVIVLLILSIQQMEVVNELNISTWDDTCSSVIIAFMSPFSFNLEASGNKYLMQCPWRERNTIMRMIFSSLYVILNILTIVMMITKKLIKFFPFLKWFYLILAIIFFAIFVIDSDGVNTGHNSCLSDFEISGTMILGSISISECFVVPFLWTLFADVGVCIIGLLLYRILRYFDITGLGFKKTTSVDFTDKKKKKKKAKGKKENTDDVDDDQRNYGGNAINAKNMPQFSNPTDKHSMYDDAQDVGFGAVNTTSGGGSFGNSSGYGNSAYG